MLKSLRGALIGEVALLHEATHALLKAVEPSVQVLRQAIVLHVIEDVAHEGVMLLLEALLHLKSFRS